MSNDSVPTLIKAASALFYAISSISIVFVNKILLTNFRFPSFLYVAFGQMFTTVLVLFALKQFRLVSYPRLDNSIPRKIFPLPIFYAANLVAGLGGTQRISLPMFTVLRRFSILLTMVLEWVVLRETPTFAVKFSVFLMIFGSMVAAIFDLSFDTLGYVLIFINNISTAANVVYMKKKLESKELGKYGLLFYNSLFMLFPLISLILWRTDDADELITYVEEGYLTVPVICCLAMSCIGGLVLNYSMVLCTAHNSALTTCCVGPIKNMVVTYVGMLSSGDYMFGWTNFLGINISVFGSFLYAYVTFRTKEHRPGGSSHNADVGRLITVEPAEKVTLLPY